MQQVTLAQLKAANPRQSNESALAYQTRLGRLHAQVNKPTLPNPFSTVPQAANETNARYAVRDLTSRIPAAMNAPLVESPAAPMMDAARAFLQGGSPAGGIAGMLAGPMAQANAWGGDTPQAQGQRQQQRLAQQPRAASINSYKDPRWGDFEAQAEQKHGLPPGTLAGIRLRGERSNNDQVSSAGARGVFQFIPATRNSILKKHGVDAWGSPAEQAEAAAILMRENLTRTGGDMTTAVRQYHGGLDSKNWGPVNDSYVARVLGGVEAAGGLTNPFDPSMAAPALAQLDAQRRALLTPFETTVQMPEMPEAPAPMLAAKTDFSKVDEALERLRPEEITEKEALSIRRRGWMEGIGQAMMQLEEGAGLGRVLMAMGGGAMAGAARGDKELEARNERVEEKMARYNVAVMQNEQQKAATIRQEAVQDLAVLNAHAMQQFQIAYNEASQRNNISLQGSNVVVSTFDSKTRQQTIKTVPIAPMVEAGIAGAKADVMGSMMSAQMQGNAMVAQHRNNLIVGAVSAEAQAALTGQQGADGNAIYESVPFMAGQVVERGLASSLFPKGQDDKAYKDLLKYAQREVMNMGLTPGSNDYAEAMKRAIGTQIGRAASVDEGLRTRLMEAGTGAVRDWAAERAAGAKTRTTTGRRGPTTIEEY